MFFKLNQDTERITICSPKVQHSAKDSEVHCSKHQVSGCVLAFHVVEIKLSPRSELKIAVSYTYVRNWYHILVAACPPLVGTPIRTRF